MSNDALLRAALRNLAASSQGTVKFSTTTTGDLGKEIGVALGRSPNPIFSFTVASAAESPFRSIAYTLSLDGTRRAATRAEALARGITVENGKLFDLNPFLLIFDYAANRFMAVSAGRLFSAFMHETARRPITSSPTATFSLTPSFQNRTVSMYATVQEPTVWSCSLASNELTLDSLVSGLRRIRDDTKMLASERSSIVAAVGARLDGSAPLIYESLPSLVGEPHEPEGMDEETGSGGWGDYPLDAVFVRTETRSVSEVVKRIQNQRYILDPDFQRDFVWPNQKQSKLIESCVMRIPLPVFYVAEAPDGRIIVVDGLQRLTTFVRFLANELRLTGLASGDHAAHLLEGKHFQDLPLNLQERIQDTQLTMYILDAKAPERARLDIFERVNSGEPLTRQQMRNALYNGPATQWLKLAAESNEFRMATGRTLNPKTMRDREAINRFCAFKLLGWKRYTTSDMDSFLAEGLVALARLDEVKRNEVFRAFERVMSLNRMLFHDHAFRKSLASQSGHADRSVINISLFEVCSVTMSHESMEGLQPTQHAAVRDSIIRLVRDEEFARAITYSTNSTGAVQKRFDLAERELAKAIEP